MLKAESLHKTYRRHAVQVRVLNNLNLEVKTGEFLSIVGASGSGQSTLLHLLGTLGAAESGGEIVRILRDINRAEGVTIVMVTHNTEIVSATDRVVRMVNGVVTEDTPGARQQPFQPRLAAV